MKIFLVLFLTTFSVNVFSSSEKNMNNGQLKDIRDVLNEARAIDLSKTKNFDKINDSNSSIFSKLSIKNGKATSVSKDCFENKKECTEEELHTLNSVR